MKKAAELIDALLSGKTLIHNAGKYEHMTSTLNCEITKDGPYFWMNGWGTAYGTAEDRLVGIVKYPANWSIELPTLEVSDTTDDDSSNTAK